VGTNGQADWVGGQPPDDHYFRSLRNFRPGVAQEKAELCLQIGRVCNKVPAAVCNGSINLTREWQAAREAAMKVVKGKNSSVHQLISALSSMSRFE
jgi:hypothetical protein